MIKQNIVGPLRDQSDWEQTNEHRLGFIKNKPFYDTRETAPLSIEWDGEIDGREIYVRENGWFTDVKVSNLTPSVEEMLAGDCFVVNAGEEYQEMASEEPIIEEDGAIVGFMGQYIQVVYDDNNSLGLSKGIWFGKWATGFGNVYTSHLRLPTYTTGELKTIDPKYLPNGGGSGMPLIISAKPQGPVNIVGEAKNMTYSDVVKAFNEGTLLGVFCNWMGYSLIPCSIEIDFATDAERPYIYIELTERTSGPATGLFWTPDGTISNQHPYPAEE